MSKSLKSEAAFNEAYASLNAAQKKAVDAIEGPVMVVAGPGTGKTQILTLRIANILLKTDTAPDSILALTFTESGAAAMRDRLRRYIGSRAHQVSINTFHGFANRLIGQYPDAYEKIIGGRPVTELEKISYLEQILDDPNITLLRPLGNTSYYISHLVRIIGKLKQEYITPDTFSSLITEQETSLEEIEKIHTKGAHKGKVRGEYSKLEKSLFKNKELLYVYRRYDSLLTDNKRYDYEDMILETVKALQSNEEMLRDLQENFQYVLADEHQDVNGAQNQILNILTSFHDSPNIFAVGDEKQAIYRFQGASLENFLFFKEHFSNTEEIQLVNNYRSGQVILDAAHSLVEVEGGPLAALRVPLEAKAVSDSVVELRNFVHQAVEDDWVVADIEAQLEEGTLPQEIAVILRTNREVEDLAIRLRKAGIAVQASADGDILQHPITNSVLSLISATILSDGERSLFEVVQAGYWQSDSGDVVKLCNARTTRRNLHSLLIDSDFHSELEFKKPEVFLKMNEVLEEARSRMSHEPPHRVVEYLLQSSGLLEQVIAKDPIEGVRVIRRLYDEIESLVKHDGVTSLPELVQSFNTRSEHGIPLNAPYISTGEKAVSVMTAHKSKGLEFSIVYIPHLVDSAWGGSAKRTYFDIPVKKASVETTYEDERRLLYVAMTRAKHKLLMSHADMNAQGKSLLPTRLLEDIDEGFIANKSTDEYVFKPEASLLNSAPKISLDQALCSELLAKRGLSVSALNNYLQSPWNYFYRNMLRIPETQALPMQFGTAIHNTLEFITRYYGNQKDWPSFTQIKQRIEVELDRMPLSKDEYVRLLEKALEMLVVYIEHLKTTIGADSKEEKSISVVFETGLSEFPEVTLTGKLDRIDFDSSGKALRTIDYKTGKPKSRNVIEGNTKGSNGDYKRQLVFYALLLELYDDDRLNTRQGTLSFVEPDSKGEIREETFDVTDAEIADLKAVIIETVQAIATGSFLNEPCNKDTSDYCHLVSLLE